MLFSWFGNVLPRFTLRKGISLWNKISELDQQLLKLDDRMVLGISVYGQITCYYECSHFKKPSNGVFVVNSNIYDPAVTGVFVVKLSVLPEKKCAPISFKVFTGCMFFLKLLAIDHSVVQSILEKKAKIDKLFMHQTD